MTQAQLDKEAVRRLIEATIAGAGDHDPAALPHLVRQRLEGQITGEIDLEQYIKQVLQERGGRGMS